MHEDVVVSHKDQLELTDEQYDRLRASAPGGTVIELVQRRMQYTGLTLTELLRQIAKWGVQSHDQRTWYAILGEEFGEVGKAICEYALAGRGDHGLAELRTELIQVAAVALAAAESLDRAGFDGER